MLASLSSAVSGLDAFQQDMNVIGNNIANVNTNGFKSATMDFGDSFSNTLQAATAATSSSGSSNTMQVGTGVAIDAISNNWTTGTLAQGNPDDMAIQGEGFFIVKDPSSTGAQYVTQAGNFTLDSSGFLVTQPNLYRAQGYAISGTTTSQTLSDIQIGTSGVTDYSMNAAGVVSVLNSSGVSQPIFQVALQNFANPDALESVGNNLYGNITNAGPTGPAAPNTNGLGTISKGEVELSNVDLSGEMANLITAQRGFEANSKIITASDEMLQTVVNMIH